MREARYESRGYILLERSIDIRFKYVVAGRERLDEIIEAQSSDPHQIVDEISKRYCKTSEVNSWIRSDKKMETPYQHKRGFRPSSRA